MKLYTIDIAVDKVEKSEYLSSLNEALINQSKSYLFKRIRSTKNLVKRICRLYEVKKLVSY